MKRFLFILIMLFDLLVTQGQEIIVADSLFSRQKLIGIMSDLKVYRPKQADLFIRKHENGMKPGRHWLGEGNDTWEVWVVDKIVPKEVQKIFLDVSVEFSDYCFLVVYFDTTRQILAAEYLMNDFFRAKLNDDQLNMIYANLMKEKIMNPDNTTSERQKSLESSNRFRKRSNEMFYMEIQLVRMSKIGERMKKDKIAWRYVQSKIETLLKKEIETDNSIN